MRAFVILCILPSVAAFAVRSLKDLLHQHRATPSDEKRDGIVHEHLQTDFFVGIKSGIGEKYEARRNRWRESGCAAEYEKAGIQFAFFLGIPLDEGHDLTSHDQGGYATEREQDLAQALFNESQAKMDIEFVPMREAYADLSDKLLAILRHGYFNTDATYFGEHDDEFCVDPSSLLSEVNDCNKNKEDGEECWVGSYWFQGDEYDSMKGVDGSLAGYFSGYGSLMSRGLAKYVVDVDYAHSALHAPYGTSADDANLGKWIQYAMDQHDVRVCVKTGMQLRDVEKETLDMEQKTTQKVHVAVDSKAKLLRGEVTQH